MKNIASSDANKNNAGSVPKIAVVGLATQYPDADTPVKFWQNLLDKKDSRSTISSQKLNANPADYQGVQGESDRFYCDKGGYIQNFSFNAEGYRIPAQQFNGLDDSFLWATDTARKALIDAGIDINNAEHNLTLNRTGIVMGTLSFPTAKSNELFVPLYHSAVEKALQHKLQQPNFNLQSFDSEGFNQQPIPASLSNGAIAHNASKLVADALGLGAAQLSLDAACASSVYSLKLACDYLHTGKADMMLAGAVSGADPFFINMGFSIFHAYPDHGISAPFDSNSKGLFAGEGAGVLVLKRLEDAERDGDHIYALVSGIGLSNDGKGQFVLSPNSDGQVKAFERAYADAAMHDESFGPANIEVIECHATGTPLGDKVELTSMERFFADKLNGTNTPLIGSAKSNLGHLLTAAGMPGIMKMIFAMRQGVLPPSINVSAPINSPNSTFGKTNLPSDVLPWPDKAGNNARHAGVSVFGFGGCNAHLLIESYQGKAQAANSTTSASTTNTSTAQSSTICAQAPMHITGMAAHFGPLSSINAFAKAIDAKQSAFTALPEQRWKGLDKHPELLSQFGINLEGEAAPKGAYINQFDFDFLRFKVPPNEDDRLISQQLLLMKVADEAIHDAKLESGSKVAVLVAMETELELHQFRGRVNLHTQIAASLKAHGVNLSESEYQALETIAMDSVLDAAKLNQYTSFIGNIMASRISSLWDFNGPAFTISAGEQSVNRCIDVAQNLLAMESRQEPLDAVIIAAVDLSGSIENIVLKTASLAQAGASAHLSSSAQPSQSLSIGEGAGAIVLQATKANASNVDLIHQALGALSDQDMTDEGTSESGFAGSYGTIESLEFGYSEQVGSIADTLLTQTGLSSTDIQLVELNQAPACLNSSSIKASQALSQLFSQSLSTTAQSCIGHTFAASGIASLLHGLLALPKSFALNNAAEPQHAIIATLSENQCSQLLLSQTSQQQGASQQRLDIDIQQQTAKKLSLVKQVSLGGRDIYQHIVNAPLAEINSIRAKTAQIKPLASAAVTAMTSRGHFEAPQMSEQQNTSTTKQAMVNSPSTIIESPMPFSDRSTQFSPAKQEPASSVQTPSLAQAQAQAQVPPAHLTAFEQNQWLAHQAQLAFLKSRNEGLKVADALMKQQLAQANGQSYALPVQSAPTQAVNVLAQPVAVAVAPTLRPNHASVPPYIAPIPADKPCIWNYADLVEYAEGDIAKVFGPDYAVIDNYSRRVRLPTTDYLLVSRVTKLDATMNQYKPCSMTTEYDIPVDAPYLVDGQIPWAVAVESGQCDLMLISYLGIDFENKGERVYRLLDCTLTFLEDLPRGGDTLRYDIKINNFAKNGDTLLFFFSYECFVGDKMILKMDGGCAGFFTDQELDDGKGVIRTEDEIKLREDAFNNPNKPRFEPLLHCAQTQFDYGQIHNLLHADIGACFAGEHQNHQLASGKQDSLCFASEKFLMIEQVVNLDVHGGAWGLGFIEGHKTLAPDHWYFPCHFKGDQVMAGSLMAEGCGQLLQFFMLHIGMHTLVENGRFQPLENASQKVRCRGQVLPQHGELTYRMEVTEIGIHPRPYAKANIDILLNGKAVVDFQNLGVMLKEESECARYINDTVINDTATLSSTETSKASGQASKNAPLMSQIPDLSAATNKGVIPLQHVEAPLIPDYPNRSPDTLPFTPYHMFEFATGNIENCFGPDFSIYRGFIPPRTPCGDLQLTTRVVDIQGKRGELKKPSSCIAEYEVPADAWYFTKNSHASVMPYSVLMEISLQPNGFISGYMGTTLGFPGQELFFRNLDGSGELLRDVDLRGKTIVNDSKLLSTVIAGSNIIQSFTFELSVDGEPFYKGSAVFGYFKGDALKNQLGIDNGRITHPWHIDNNVAADITVDLLDKQSRVFHAPANQPHYRLAGGQLNFIDKAEIVDKGGKNGLGYLSGSRTIDPSDWFFQFHFHQDPVMPGSLGVEAIIELMQTYAISKDLGKGFTNPKFGQILSDIKWKYRGQINPLNKQMSLDVHISAVKDENGKRIIIGDANLSKDGLRIYEVKDIAICIEEA
ncbi:beta-ketoacyl synthase N-terminal-like domain-containing protein [Shewanella sp. 10N.286.52.B9]|uniref:hotdog fold thioesterase n=1 Tax=Shewanella sp. 10N.286.52.B9 TaxID=1880837 RepID=UPI000C816E0E|nr:beta-ketoacyl synthase N-terminal-like domain-containing protein [Shewanella sp. 10N.286.52.B9]PMG42192.1 beta-hydroxyacyl-ACP dehydratase [Shewanella sp. 10N.286.52.B9]